MTNRHPRAGESPARAAQLERLKEQRRAKRESAPPRRGKARSGGFHHVAVPLEESANTVTLALLIDELRRISMGGVMPSPAVYDLARPALWPDADACCEQFGLTWRDLAQDAGLKLARATRERFG